MDRFRSLPMSRSAVLTGRTLADISTNLIQLVVVLGVGFAVGFWFKTSAAEVLAGIGLMLLIGYAFSWVFAFVGLIASSPEAMEPAWSSIGTSLGLRRDCRSASTEAYRAIVVR